MKRYVFGLLGLALLGGPVLGQAPPAAPGVIVPESAGCANGSCPTKLKTVCVPEHYAKKTTKWVYSCGSEPICTCYLRGLFKGCGCKDGGHCENPRTRRYLIKKVRTCETDAVKCVPAEVPDYGRAHGHPHAAAPVPGPVYSPVVIMPGPSAPQAAAPLPPPVMAAPSPYLGAPVAGPSR